MITFLVVFLFIASITNDLTTGTFPDSSPKQDKENSSTPHAKSQAFDKNTSSSERYDVMKHEVNAGQTVLSIIEQINHPNLSVTYEQMLEDFRTLNKDQDPHQIQVNEVYFFPVYR